MSHYVNNAEFLTEMNKRAELVKQCVAEGKEPPPVSNFIAKSIMDICNHLSYKPNFIGYSYRDDMVSDAIINCLRFVDNFNSEKSSNPFSYFTQIAFYAFLRRIDKEKKEAYVKGALLVELPLDELVDLEDYDGSPMDFVEELRQKYHHETKDYEKKQRDKKIAASVLEGFMEEEDAE